MAKIVFALALLSVGIVAVLGEQCGENEIYELVTPLCPVTCQTRHRMHCLGLKNAPSCQCAAGHLRDTTTGKCVPTAKCPSDKIDEYAVVIPTISPEEKERIRQSCDPATQVYSETTPTCPITCTDGHVNPIHCLGLMLKPSCQCRSGFVLLSHTHKCIARTECGKQ